MNMFKKNRKGKVQEDALDALTGVDGPPVVKAHRALTRKKKKQEIVEAPVFDLGSALPDTNDFRTSLLMPNLSARFSMLREQDDPNSLLGKASDDSVLFPKRSSRMNLFSSNNLTDIAEVESIHSSFRPPFAENRHTSMSDGYASDDGGSMMNRSRPGEGNNLFGGRQKLYKITTGSAKNLPDEGTMVRGKHMYESDVSLSAFQQMRLREKEQRELDERTDRNSFPVAESEEQGSTTSPLNAFSQNRGTQSSTNSGPSNRRTSTAATSVVSDSPLPQQTSNVAINKVREQDANSSAESIGFASSPSFRKIREEGTRSPYQLGQSRSAVNLRDNSARQSPVPGPHNFRGMSPPLSATNQPLDFGLRDVGRPQPSPSRFQTTSPTSQLDVDQDEMLAHNVRPNDRGKATAMGMFNKPLRHYDDAQFQQRQVQMHEGRNSPMSTNSRAGSRASPEPTRSGRQSFASVNSHLPQDDNHAPQIPPIPDYPPSPVSNRRSSATSTGRRSTSRPRAKSSASSKEAAVQARVQSLIRRQNAELAALEENHLGQIRSVDDQPAVSPEKSNGQRNYFDNSDHSDDESKSRRPSARSITNHMPPAPPPPADIHPAFREGIQDFDFGTDFRRPSFPRHSNHSATSRARPSTDRGRQSQHDSMLSADDNESVGGPTTGLGLSGLIRTHLRQDSDKSSMLPPPSPALPGDGSRGSMSSTTRTVTESVKSDPFEFDNDRLSVRPPVPQEQPPPTPTTIMSQRAQQLLANAAAMRDAHAAAATTPTVGGPMSGEPDHYDDGRTRQDSVNHQRSESTETQREQQRFDEELAERQRRIREGLKSVQERSRSRSPDAERGRGNQGHGFSLPRFPGRSNTGDKFEPQSQSKAMKMLGITSTSRDQPSPRPPIEHFPGDADRSRNMSSRSGHRPPNLQDADYSNGRHTPNTGRAASRNGGPNHGYDRPPPPRSTTPSSRSNARSRSNSAAADRSASRNKSIPEADRAMMPGAFPASPFLHESPQNEYGQRSDSAGGNRPYERSGSSAAGHYADRPAYFNSKSLTTPMIPGDFTPRPSPRPSPLPPSESAFGPPSLPPTSPVPPSPNPIHGRTTPSASSGRITPSRDRKRSVTKGMISEPKFVSSTSTVPLVHLPRDGGPQIDPMQAPPLPAMNPRRRGHTNGEPNVGQFSVGRPGASPLPIMPESPVNADFQSQSVAPPQPRARNKLRKSSSEGGSMAARARNQALMAEIAKENERSPNVAVFPNKSATSLHMAPHEGGMF